MNTSESGQSVEADPEFWVGYVMGRINKNMQAEEVMAILLEAFTAFHARLVPRE